MLGAQLGANTPNVDVHSAAPAVEVVPPHFGQQLGTRAHPADALGQESKQLEFLVGEVQGRPVD
jgi:hypothetical protein